MLHLNKYVYIRTENTKKTMNEFLRTVVRHYFNPLPCLSNGTPDYLSLTDWMFVFPNRRASLFFGKYLCEENQNKTILSPKCITIGDLFGLFSDYRVADRTELLFRLYRVYNEVRGCHNQADNTERFDKFLFWGEMMLRDFDEVDKYLVETKTLFCNIKDLKTIEEEINFLNDETKALLRTFWMNIAPDDTQPGAAKKSFVQTWSILYEVYDHFRKELKREGLAYEGMRQRDVVERLDTDEIEERLKQLPKHIVLTGITAINKAERHLLLWLKERGILECCWDYSEEHIADLPFIRQNLADFDNVLTPEEQMAGIVPTQQKKMSRMAIPSGVGQTTEAATVLARWSNEDPFHTAVVLPDEQLLDSMLYALPESYKPFNVTMGYALKSTPIMTLVEALAFLQKNVKYGQHGRSYYYKAVLPILSHAYLLDCNAELCAQLRHQIVKFSNFQVEESFLQKTDLLRLIFNVEAPINYLRKILRYLLNEYKSKEDADKYILARECLIVYLQVLETLDKELRSSGMNQMDAASLFHLIIKLAKSRSVSFSGEPMQGLQIMGVLETRAIDFERIVLLSMNEGKIPAKPSQDSFIPHSLRQAFGLPTQVYKDQIFAYHFYRLIGRAKELVFLYDSRTDGMQTGEQSRYLLQLEYLSGIKFNKLNINNRITTTPEEVIVIPKNEDVRRKLDEFKVGGTRHLSASSLKVYLNCPLQFYFAHIQRLLDEEELEEELDNSKFGTMLHQTLKELYEPCKDKWVMADNLKALIDDPQFLYQCVASQYTAVMGCSPETGYQQLVCNLIVNHLISILKHDLTRTPFRYITGEQICFIKYPVNDKLAINMQAVLDRLDIRKSQDGKEETLRVVDYKTGTPKSNTQLDPNDLLSETSKCSSEAFQVILYCLLLETMTPKERLKIGLTEEALGYTRLEPNLYFSRSFLNENEQTDTIVLDDYRIHNAIIKPQINQLLEKIFDVETPFTQTEKLENCKYCKFVGICNKKIKDD